MLTAVLGAYLLMALAVAVIVPSDPAPDPRLTPPDESAHWLMVRHLATGGGLPVFSEHSIYEAHQPPLFYLSALWCYWVGGEQGLLLGRLWCALLGLGTLLITWEISVFLVGDALWSRLAAVGALAFVPGRLFIVASVSNDGLFELLSALTLWLALRAVSRGVDVKGAAWLGVALGLTLLTKTTGLVLVPIVVLALVLEPAWRSRGGIRLLVHGGTVALIVLCLWGWWVARNVILYGEPLATGVFQQVFLKDRATPGFFLSRGMTWAGYWMLVAQQTWWSLWGVFGQATVYMPKAFYTAGSLCAVGGGAGWVMQALRARSSRVQLDSRRRMAWALSLLLALLTWAAFVRFNQVFYQAQARYFLGVSGVMACALAGGVCGLGAGRHEPVPALLLIAVLAGMAVMAIAAHVSGTYSFLPPGT